MKRFSLKLLLFACLLAIKVVTSFVSQNNVPSSTPPLFGISVPVIQNLKIELTSQELANSVTVFAKIDQFCREHSSNHALQGYIANTVVIGCFELVKSQLRNFLTENNYFGYDIFLTVQQQLQFYSFYSHKYGITRHLFNKSYPEIFHPLQVFSWRSAVALLIPIPCDYQIVLTLFASIRENYLEDVSLWMNIYLILGLEPSCSYPTNFAEYVHSHLPAHQIVLIHFEGQRSLTEKFDYLSLIGYQLNCNFFFTLHPTSILLQRYLFWAGVVRLIHQHLLENQEGFGYVIYPVTPDSVSDCSPDSTNEECKYSVACFGRSHVEAFILPILSTNTNQTTFKDFSSWTHCEEEGYNLLTCMLMYCDAYLAIKNSCYHLNGYLSAFPSPSSTADLVQSNRLQYERDIPLIITRNRLTLASWLSKSSPYGFQYTTHSLTYTSGYFANPLESEANHHESTSNKFKPSPSSSPAPSSSSSSSSTNPTASVAYITALYGTYELSPKPFAKQSIPSDFICFTDNENIPGDGWIIDHTPYHKMISLPYDSPEYLNSLSTNLHPMNVAKFYKIAFYLIPRLQHYDIIIWLDGNVIVSNSSTSELISNLLSSQHEDLVLFEHWRDGLLFKEVQAAAGQSKYNTTKFAGFTQPRQDILLQYDSYLTQYHYDERYWKSLQPLRPQYGMWVTCFIGYNMKSNKLKQFLAIWHQQILQFSTQDQISFSFTCQYLQIHPHSFPDDLVEGNSMVNTLFYKVAHGA